MLPPPPVIAEELGGCKKQSEQGNRIRPRQPRRLWKEWIQWAQRPASSHTQNAEFLNLIPDLWRSDCLLSLLHSCICLTSPPASSEQFSLSYWDPVSQAQSPKLYHQINNSLLSGCDYTFQSTAVSGLGCSPWDLHWVLRDFSSWLFSLVCGLQ